MTMSETTISDAEVAKVEADLAAKRAAEDAARQAEIEKVVDSAVAKGKEQALKEFQAEQARKEAEERTKRMEEELKRLKEDSEKRVQELSKQFELKVQEIESQRKGIARNESPFNQAGARMQTSTPQLTKEKQDQIEYESMKQFYRMLGRPAPE